MFLCFCNYLIYRFKYICNLDSQITPGNLIRVVGGYALKIFTQTSGHDLETSKCKQTGKFWFIDF